MQWIETCIRNPVKVTVGVILVLLFGAIALASLPVQLTPNVETPTITVETRWPGASPQEVEREIVQEQEEQLKSVEGVTKMSSESADSRGQITLEFGVGTDMREALVKVNSNLQQVREYPANADEPVITTSNLADRPIAWFVLIPRPPSDEELDSFVAQHPAWRDRLRPVQAAHNSGLRLRRLRDLAERHPDAGELKELLPPQLDLPKLRTFCEDHIEARLERVPGVSAANVIGGQEEELQVVVDPHKLAARQLTIGDLRQALLLHNRDTSGGDVSEGKRRWVVRTLGVFRSPQQVQGVIVARRDGRPVYVRDVATVREGHKKPDGLTRRFGGASIAINAQRETGANVLEVMEGLRQANREINAGLLADRGLLLEQVYDETEYIHSAIDLVTDNILLGAVLTFVTLLLFLRSGRSTVIIAAHILISTMGAFLVMGLAGRSLNVPALGGLAFAVGMLVDNAIVMLENIYRRHQMGESAPVASVRGAKEVWGALLNASLVNLAVFLPVLTIRQEVGQLFRDIALAISASVGLSLIVAVAVVPTAATRLLAHRRPERLPAWLAWWLPLREALEAVLLRPLDRIGSAFVRAVVGVNARMQHGWLLRTATVLVLVGASAVVAWGTWPKVEYLPNGNRNLVIGMLLPPPGYNIDQLTAIGAQIEGDLRPYWEAQPGTPEAERYPPIGDFFYVARNRNLFLGLRAAEPLEAARLLEPVQRYGSQVPGMIVVAKQASLFEQGLVSGRTVDIEITGPEITELVQHGRVLMGLEKGSVPPVQAVIDGAQALPRPSLDLSSPELHVTPRWEQAADLTVDATELGYTVDALIDGAYAGDYYRGGDKIDLSIVGQESYTQHTQDLERLPVATPTGRVVPLAAVAQVTMASGPEQINHRERQRAITIQVTPPPNVPLEDAMQRIDAQIVQPLREAGAIGAGGYEIRLAGTADKLRDTWNALKWKLLLAVVITYLLMAALFESWIYPFVVITSVPLGAVGGVAGLWLLNLWADSPAQYQALDMLTMLGFVILVGTVVNNPILIVEQALIHMREEGMPQRQAILEAVRNRIRPIFMTTLAGLIGLLPLVLGRGAGSELYRGIGAVLLGGMVVSTVFTLVLVPALFSLLLDLKRLAARRLLGHSEPADIGPADIGGDGQPVPNPWARPAERDVARRESGIESAKVVS